MAPATSYLGALGMTTGVTAFVGMRSIGKPQPGETVVVSAAAGAVGSIAAQVAKLDGAIVIGIAGGPQKRAVLTGELGLAAATDYKNEDVAARLRELAPGGVDVFFDNVGNPITSPNGLGSSSAGRWPVRPYGPRPGPDELPETG